VDGRAGSSASARGSGSRRWRRAWLRCSCGWLLCGCGEKLCGSCDGVYAVLTVFVASRDCVAAFLSRLFLCPGRSSVQAIPVSRLFSCPGCSSVPAAPVSRLFLCPNCSRAICSPSQPFPSPLSLCRACCPDRNSDLLSTLTIRIAHHDHMLTGTSSGCRPSRPTRASPAAAVPPLELSPAVAVPAVPTAAVAVSRTTGASRGA
jgi:hypothetical protein